MPPTFPGSLSITAISLLILTWHIWAKKDSLTVDDSPQKGEDLVGTRCWTNGNGLEAQWLEQGGTVDRGMFWYKCNAEGKLVPSGCLDGKRSRIPLGGTFISDGYLLECSLWGGLPRLSTGGCSPDGKQSFRIDQTWDQEQDQHWWRCVSEGMLVRPRPVGCLKGNRRLSIGEQFDDDNNKTTFECQHDSNGMPGLNAIGCITADGRHFRVGQQWKEGDFLFYCKRTVTEAGCQQTCIGCVSQNQTLFDGDWLTQNGSIFQCEVRPKRHALKPVACVSAGGVERVLDCKWRDQTLNGHRVERQCVLRAGRAVVDTLGCVFVKDGIARLFLRPGSYAIWRPSMDQQPIGVACHEAADGGGGEPQLQIFPQAETAEKTRGLALDAEPKM